MFFCFLFCYYLMLHIRYSIHKVNQTITTHCSLGFTNLHIIAISNEKFKQFKYYEIRQKKSIQQQKRAGEWYYTHIILANVDFSLICYTLMDLPGRHRMIVGFTCVLTINSSSIYIQINIYRTVETDLESNVDCMNFYKLY